MQDQTNEKQMLVLIKLPPGLPRLKADRLRFTQVMSNLLSNACKYSPAGATTTIKAKAKQKHVQIDVSDTGVGISKADQARVFDKFFRAASSSTSESSGTGLGLFVTRHMVAAHGGKIWLESEEGKGSPFSFTLPRADT